MVSAILCSVVSIIRLRANRAFLITSNIVMVCRFSRDIVWNMAFMVIMYCIVFQ